MHVGNQRCSEIRGFATTGYYQGDAGDLPGGPANLVVSALVRVLDIATATEVIFENREDLGGGNLAGWSLVRLLDDADGYNDTVRFEASIFGGASGNLVTTVEIARSFCLGRLLRLDVVFDASNDTLTLFANGQGVFSDSDPAVTAVAASTAPTIGARRGDTLPATTTSVLALGYAGSADPAADVQLLPSFLDTLKRADLGDKGALAYTSRYSARTLAGFAGKNGAGYPRTLADQAGNADMAKQGAAALTVGVPQVVWAVARNENAPG